MAVIKSCGLASSLVCESIGLPALSPADPFLTREVGLASLDLPKPCHSHESHFVLCLQHFISFYLVIFCQMRGWTFIYYFFFPTYAACNITAAYYGRVSQGPESEGVKKSRAAKLGKGGSGQAHRRRGLQGDAFSHMVSNTRGDNLHRKLTGLQQSAPRPGGLGCNWDVLLEPPMMVVPWLQGGGVGTEPSWSVQLQEP